MILYFSISLINLKYILVYEMAGNLNEIFSQKLANFPQ